MLSRSTTPVEDTILVVGAGTMGAGIAYVAARGGYTVQLIDPLPEAREKGMARIAKDAQRAGDDTALHRITAHAEIPPRSNAFLAIEAVPERTDLKQTIFAALDAALDPDALIATNTSSLSVADLARHLSHRERVLGLHFFNPPAAMKLVEIVATHETSDAALDRAGAFVERIGKTGVECADTPGFIVNRVARPFYLQALRALERGVASIEELDALARSAGFRMGPFELMDLIGLDVNLATSESVYERLDAERLAPRPLQRRLVAEGKLGRKTGAGFYVYENGDYEKLDLAADVDENVDPFEEFVSVIGYGQNADALAIELSTRVTRVQRIENDDLIAQLDPEATLVIDVGDGFSDRGEIVLGLDRDLEASTMIFVDAYATDLQKLAPKLQHPERVLGYGVLGALDSQSAVEIVDASSTGDDALALAQELFGALGKATVLVEDLPGLFLGRTIGSIVNEAMIAVSEDVGSPDDVDLAMTLGVNYPRGPIDWGREIGGRRIERILKRLASAEDASLAPHRTLHILDEELGVTEAIEEAETRAMNNIL
jgi:3-hydroxybutyryl-CoA dehydrogenase